MTSICQGLFALAPSLCLFEALWAKGHQVGAEREPAIHARLSHECIWPARLMLPSIPWTTCLRIMCIFLSCLSKKEALIKQILSRVKQQKYNLSCSINLCFHAKNYWLLVNYVCPDMSLMKWATLPDKLSSRVRGFNYQSIQVHCQSRFR